jgi:4-hydroxy-tetrahydrodipicolinate reductase
MSARIVVSGITGRMGREVIAAAGEMPEITIVGGLLRPGAAIAATERPEVLGASLPAVTIADDPAPVLAGTDVLVDFTTPAGTVAYARACAGAGVALVSGTTGLEPADMAELRAAAERVPVFHARNMSLGIATLLSILPTITAALGDFDVEIVETHHRHKVDAPSGTALALAEAIAGGQGAALNGQATFGRHGIAPRQRGEIGIHAVRGGGNPGEHQIIFAADGEEIRLSHRSFNRRAYASGALRAALFVANQPPGLYGLEDLIRASA